MNLLRAKRLLNRTAINGMWGILDDLDATEYREVRVTIGETEYRGNKLYEEYRAQGLDEKRADEEMAAEMWEQAKEAIDKMEHSLSCEARLMIIDDGLSLFDTNSSTEVRIKIKY